MATCTPNLTNINNTSCDDGVSGSLLDKIYLVPTELVDEDSIVAGTGSYTTFSLSSTAESFNSVELYVDQPRSATFEAQEAEGNSVPSYSVSITGFIPNQQAEKVDAIQKLIEAGKLVAVVQYGTEKAFVYGYDQKLKKSGGIKFSVSGATGEEFTNATGYTFTISGTMLEVPRQMIGDIVTTDGTVSFSA